MFLTMPDVSRGGLKISQLAREVLSSIPDPVASGTVSSTARHRFLEAELPRR